VIRPYPGIQGGADLDPDVYRELRRRAAIDGRPPGEVVSELLEGRLE